MPSLAPRLQLALFLLVGGASVRSPAAALDGDPRRQSAPSVQAPAEVFTALSPERRTLWRPGVAGGIPARTRVCRTLDAGAFGQGAVDATAAIQSAIDACPPGQVLQLSAGTFTVGTTGTYLLVNRSITLRGAGPGRTTLRKPNGATAGSYRPGPVPAPVLVVGAARFDDGQGRSVPLTADAVKGASSVSVGSAAGLAAGQYVLLDELSNASWQPDPTGRGKVWASPDWRVVWQRHLPPQPFDDPWPDAAAWFSRPDRPTNEIKQIERVSGNTVYFTTPVHIRYRAAQSAQLATFGQPFVEQAGVEDLTVTGGDSSNVVFTFAASCWARRVESTGWLEYGVLLSSAFRIEVRESYVHDAAWPEPGGAGYGIGLSHGTSEDLVENCILRRANKMMVAQSAGTASVFGYNFVDDGMIGSQPHWIEVGLNASHMAGSHHVLFEGNDGFNWDSDKTHGGAILHTVFRNHLRGVRTGFGDAASASHVPKRCAGAQAYSYWHSFVGNVLGVRDGMRGWTYESGSMGTPSVFLLGWDDVRPWPVDPKVAATTLRHGNLDFLGGAVRWDPAIADHALPPSLYLARAPDFFRAGRGHTWPWVDPTGPTPLHTLPARARFEAGTPFQQP